MKREVKFLKKFCGIKLCFFATSLVFLISIIAFPITKSQASKKEIYVLLNMLVEKGYITAAENNEILNAIENIEKEDKEKKLAEASKNIAIAGYLQSRYNSYDWSGKRDEFSIKRARISFSGKPIENTSFKIEIDVTKGKNNDLLTDAWIKLTHFNKANITIGQFKIPYSEEYSISSSALDTIERSLPINHIATEYDKGIMINGNLPDKRFYYGIALVNGTGGNKNEDNNNKDIAARVVFSPWINNNQSPVSKLAFGAGYQTGKQDQGSNETNRTRYSYMLKYSYNNFKIYGEYLYQQEEKKTSTIKKDGWYISTSYTFPLGNDRSIQPVLKYEVYDPDKDATENTQNIFTAGINFMLNKYTKLTTNYRWRTDQKGGKIESNMNEWFSQLQIKF